MNKFGAALRFLTICPLPGAWGTMPTDLPGSLLYFPLVGLLIGGLAAALAYGFACLFPVLPAAALLVIALAVVSGGLHLDGVADSADGLLSARPRLQKMAIMHDSRTGPMGVFALTAVLLLKFACLASLPASEFWRAALLMPVAGRSALVFSMILLPYARPEGLARVFYQKRKELAGLTALGVLALTAFVAASLRGLLSAGSALAMVLLFSIYLYRQLGGHTGDTLGASCELAEVTTVLTLTAL